MAVTIAADGFGPQDLPQVYQPPVNLKTSRRQARYDKWRFAGTAVTLNPDGVKVKDAILSLTPHSDSSIGNLKSNEKLEMFAWSVEEQAWEYAPNSLAKSGTVSATLSHFSLYVPVITELGNPVVVPSPAPPLPDKPREVLTDGEIAAAVIVPLLAVAAACFVSYWYLYLREKQPKSPGPLIESSVGFDNTSVVPESIPEPTRVLEMSPVLPDEWYKCTGCESPIKASWPRCPTCRSENKGSGEPVIVDTFVQHDPDAAAAEPSRARTLAYTGTLQEETLSAPQGTEILQAEPPAPPGADQKMLNDFTGICPQCEAPVKSAWKRCPSCKAKILEPGEQPPDAALKAPGIDEVLSYTAEGAAGAIRLEEFTMECSNQGCRAPGIHSQKHAT